MSTLSDTNEPVKPDATNVRAHLKAEHQEGWIYRIHSTKDVCRVQLTSSATLHGMIPVVVDSLRELWQDGRERVQVASDRAIVIGKNNWQRTVPVARYTPPMPEGKHYLYDEVVKVLGPLSRVAELEIRTEDEAVVIENLLTGQRSTWAYEELETAGLHPEIRPYDMVVLVLPNRVTDLATAELEANVEYLERWGIEHGVPATRIEQGVRDLRDGWADSPVVTVDDEDPVEMARQRKLREQIVRAMRLNGILFPKTPEKPQERTPLLTQAEWRGLWPLRHPDGRGWPDEATLLHAEQDARECDYGFDDVIRLHEGHTLDEAEILWLSVHEDDELEQPRTPLGEGILLAAQVLLHRARARHALVLDSLSPTLLRKDHLVLSSRMAQWLSVIDTLRTHQTELSSRDDLMSQYMAHDVGRTSRRYQAEVARLANRLSLVNEALKKKEQAARS